MANSTGLYRFSVRLPEELVVPMKIAAIQLGQTIQEFVATAIQEKTKTAAAVKPARRTADEPRRTRVKREEEEDTADGQ